MIGQERLQLGKRNVGCRIVGTQDQPGVRLDLARPSITALLLRCRRPVLSRELLPPHRARRTDAEPHRRLTT